MEKMGKRSRTTEEKCCADRRQQRKKIEDNRGKCGDNAMES